MGSAERTRRLGSVANGPGARQRLHRALGIPIMLALLGVGPGLPALAQPDETLRIYPIPPVLAVGDAIVVEAYYCPRGGSGDDYGADGIPGTQDDDCRPARRARWSIEDRKVASVSRRRGPSVEVTARRAGATQLVASDKPSKTLSFESRVPLRVREAGTDGEDGQGEDGQGEAAGRPPGDAVIVVQPPFVILPPGSEQPFVAYRCPLVGRSDPRGPDMLPGNADDFCRLASARWSLLGGGESVSLEPEEGIFTVLSVARDEAQRFTFLAAETQTDPSQAGTPTTGAVVATVQGHPGSAGYGVDPAAEAPEPPPKGDVNGDDVVDVTDLAAFAATVLRFEGDEGFDAGADFDRDGFVGPNDLAVLMMGLGQG